VYRAVWTNSQGRGNNRLSAGRVWANSVGMDLEMQGRTCPSTLWSPKSSSSCSSPSRSAFPTRLSSARCPRPPPTPQRSSRDSRRTCTGTVVIVNEKCQSCISRCMDNSHQLRDKTVCQDLGNAQHVPWLFWKEKPRGARRTAPERQRARRSCDCYTNSG
jgi:hypothetical protein